ncbi:hypothetical protein ACP90_02465 [Labrenzia sp. CP4]|jgi:hypothetical protein|nr:hypothetical protein ACP90_02465 [Labrenzia sp. CP4]
MPDAATRIFGIGERQIGSIKKQERLFPPRSRLALRLAGTTMERLEKDDRLVGGINLSKPSLLGLHGA